MSQIEQLQYGFNSFLILFSGFLTVFMFIGFTCYSTGIVRSKNTTATLTAHLATLAIVSILFLLAGHPIIYGNIESLNTVYYFLSKVFSLNLAVASDPSIYERYSSYAAVFFHLMLPCVALAIIIGTTAERLKLWAFILFAIVFTIAIYPIQASWLWGNGFLQRLGFIDQSGAGLVFLTAAMAGLSATVLLGPRLNKYQPSSNRKPMFPTNIPFAVIGVLLIGIGSFGFNAGVHFVNAKLDSLDTLSKIFINIFSTAAIASTTTLIITRIFYGKTDIVMLMSGAMAGLAAISASPASASFHATFIIGTMACFTLLFSMWILEKLRVDDPMAFISIFGSAAILGLLATAFTSNNPVGQQLITQSIGIGVIILWSGGISLLAWLLIQYVIGIRIAPEDESRGLDIFDCGMPAYPEFTVLRD